VTAPAPGMTAADTMKAAGAAADRAPMVAALASAAFLLFAATLPIGLAPMTIAGALAVGFAVVAFVGRPLWARTPLEIPALLWFAACVLATVLAADPRASASSLDKSVLPLVAGVAAAQARERSRAARAVAALLAAGSLAAMIGTARFLAAGGRFPTRAIGLSGSWMTFGVAMMLLTSLAVAIAVTARTRGWRLGASAAALATTIALATSFTRAAWIGAGVAMVIVAAVARPRALVVITLLGVVAWLLPGDFGARLRSAFDPAHPMNREREYMWQAGRHLVADHPWFGVGLINLQPLIEPYRAPEAMEHPKHLHDSYLQVAVTTGLVGLAAFIALCVGLLRTAGEGIVTMRRARGLAAGVRLGAAAGAAGFLIAALFDHTFGDRQLVVMLFTLAGIAWAARGWDTAAA
jgi:O-antigen ligase